jgi:hypothetical protein
MIKRIPQYWFLGWLAGRSDYLFYQGDSSSTRAAIGDTRNGKKAYCGPFLH